MYRLWGKIYKNGKIINDIVIEDKSSKSLSEKTDFAITEICMKFDLQKPLWLQDNEKDFNKFKRTQFNKHHFIEQIEFDYLEIEVIEEDINK